MYIVGLIYCSVPIQIDVPCRIITAFMTGPKATSTPCPPSSVATMFMHNYSRGSMMNSVGHTKLEASLVYS